MVPVNPLKIVIKQGQRAERRGSALPVRDRSGSNKAAVPQDRDKDLHA
jgi:hypothetical protein